MIETHVATSWLAVQEDFGRALFRKRLSPMTVRTYRGGLRNLGVFLAANQIDDVRQLNRDVLERWQDDLTSRSLRSSTCCSYSIAVRQFIQWAADQGLIEGRLERAITQIHVPDGRPRPIPPLDLAVIKSYLLPKRPRMGSVALRDRALFFYYLTSGARVSEALQVRKDRFEDPVVRQKGGSEKILRIPPATAELVSDYIASRKDDSPWLWISHKTNKPLGRLGPPGVREIWRKLARKLEIQPWTTHQLRHTCCTELLEAGVPSLAVMEHMGHHGLGSQHIYGEVRDAQRQQAIDAMQKLAGGSRSDVLPKLSMGGRWQ